MRNHVMLALLACLILVASATNTSAFVTHFIDFEGYFDYTPLTDQYAADWITFSGATVITAGFSLNEFDFPPHSGQNVVFDEADPIWLNFDALTYDWSAYFTYAAPVTINAYDFSNNLVATVSSSLFENYVSSGNPPNELLSLSLASGFTSLEIVGDPFGASFVMDDMTYITADEPIPEPSTLLLFGLALAGMGVVRFKRK